MKIIMEILKRLLSVSLVICVMFINLPRTKANAADYKTYTAQITAAPNGADSIISMTFDDGLYDTAVFLNKMFKIYNLKGSAMMLPANISSNTNLIKSWQTLFSDGYLEAQNHSATHMVLPSDSWAKANGEKYLENNTAENYQKELIDSKTTLTALFDNDIVAFAPSNNTLSDDAYEIVRKPLAGGAETSILVDSNQPELVAMKNGRVYYTLNSNLYSTTDGETSKSYLSAPLKGEKQTTEITSTYVILDDADGLDRGVVAVYYDGSNYRMLYQNGYNYQAITTVSEGTKEITILASQRDEIYYQIADSNELYMLRLTLSYENSKFVLENAEEPKVIASSFTTKNGDNTIYDYDLEHFYTYEQVKNSQLQYLKMYSIHSPKKDADDKVVGQYIGLLSEQDTTLVNAE